MLLVACLLSIFLKDINDAAVIAVILIINTGLGFYQEFKSEKAIGNLQKLVSKQVLAIRDGEQTLLDEKVLVPGDVIILKEGDIAPADTKLIKSDNFRVNESALTGESIAISKTIKSGEDLVYAGSTSFCKLPMAFSDLNS